MGGQPGGPEPPPTPLPSTSGGPVPPQICHSVLHTDLNLRPRMVPRCTPSIVTCPLQNAGARASPGLRPGLAPRPVSFLRFSRPEPQRELVSPRPDRDPPGAPLLQPPQALPGSSPVLERALFTRFFPKEFSF